MCVCVLSERENTGSVTEVQGDQCMGFFLCFVLETAISAVK